MPAHLLRRPAPAPFFSSSLFLICQIPDSPLGGFKKGSGGGQNYESTLSCKWLKEKAVNITKQGKSKIHL